ncbi:MAG TPA: RNA polymerase sigma factor [Polyangiaceae bacterium]|nr:RNA polymerase sigma factor [Polyangiaceae bacterium]
MTREAKEKSASRLFASRVVAKVQAADPPDRQLVALLRARDERGFELAYARYAQRIFGFLFRLTRSREPAEDLFQHTFLRLAEQGSSLRRDSDLKAWLFAVARNAFHSQFRSQAALSRFMSAQVDEASAPRLDSGLELNELELALGRLSASDREILLLVGIEDLEQTEAAAVLGIDLVTLRKRLSRARARLAEALDALGNVVPKSEVRR